MQHLHDEAVLEQQGRGGVAPVQTEAAVVLLDIALPELIALEVERLQNSGAGHHPDRLAVGHRRGRRHVLLALHVVPAAQEFLPQDRALLFVDGPEVQVAAIGFGDVKENRIAPDDRGCAAQIRQRKLPGDILVGIPAHGKVLLMAHAVEIRTAPLRPVLGR